jgi:hypothetical protein
MQAPDAPQRNRISATLCGSHCELPSTMRGVLITCFKSFDHSQNGNLFQRNESALNKQMTAAIRLTGTLL